MFTRLETDQPTTTWALTIRHSLGIVDGQPDTEKYCLYVQNLRRKGFIWNYDLDDIHVVMNNLLRLVWNVNPALLNLAVFEPIFATCMMK